MRGHEREIPRFPHWLSTRVFWTALFHARLLRNPDAFSRLLPVFVARHQAAVAAQKIRIRLKSFEVKHMAAACDKIIEAAKATEASISGPVPLPTKPVSYTHLTLPTIYSV